MSDKVRRTAEEIRDFADAAAEQEYSGEYSGMNYQQGLRAALEWVLGEGERDEIL